MKERRLETGDVLRLNPNLVAKASEAVFEDVTVEPMPDEFCTADEAVRKKRKKMVGYKSAYA